MKYLNYKVILLIIVLCFSCAEEKQNFFDLGKNSFENRNYPLAKNQLLTIKNGDAHYEEAQRYLQKIDSIERMVLDQTKQKDSLKRVESTKLREKYAGNYKVEVIGTSSYKQVEIYELDVDGKAEWLWINYDANRIGHVDDRKKGRWIAKENSVEISIPGNTEMITEIYIKEENKFINKTLKKRLLVRTKESY